MKKDRILNVLLSIFSCIAAVAYPCLFIYFRNASEADFADILLVMALLFAVACTLLALLTLVYKRITKAATVTTSVMIVFMNFAIIENAINLVFPRLYYWHVAYILLVLLVIWGVVVKRYVKEEVAGDINETRFVKGIFCKSYM